MVLVPSPVIQDILDPAPRIVALACVALVRLPAIAAIAHPCRVSQIAPHDDLLCDLDDAVELNAEPVADGGVIGVKADDDGVVDLGVRQGQ